MSVPSAKSRWFTLEPLAAEIRLAHIDTNFLARASSRSSELIIIPVEVLLIHIMTC